MTDMLLDCVKDIKDVVFIQASLPMGLLSDTMTLLIDWLMNRLRFDKRWAFQAL